MASWHPRILPALWLAVCLAPASALPQDVPQTAPPPVPAVKSPVDQFREWLALRPAERSRALTNRPPHLRQQLMAKLREYDALSANERELRLRTTELRYYLMPVLNLAPESRPAFIERIPAELRDLVRDRLDAWDSLSPDLRRDLLDNESIIRYFRETQAQSEPARASEIITPGQRAQLEGGIARWLALPPEQRRKVMERFDRLFVMSGREREALLKTLSDAERAQIETALRSLEGLPPAQRARCVQSLSKFASLSPGERAQFLRSAEKWKQLTPDQRDAWRKMAAKIAILPPMPPGASPWLPPPLPPMPGKPLADGN